MCTVLGVLFEIVPLICVIFTKFADITVVEKLLLFTGPNFALKLLLVGILFAEKALDDCLSPLRVSPLRCRWLCGSINSWPTSSLLPFVRALTGHQLHYC